MAGLAAAETQLNGVLGRLFAVAEAYPDLKANQNMIALQQELTATENQIASARQIFNNSIMQYNTTLQSFPTNLVANALGFAPAQLFELETDKERQVPAGVVLIREHAGSTGPFPRTSTGLGRSGSSGHACFG